MTTEAKKPQPPSSDFLIRGSDKLKQIADFKPETSEEDRQKLSQILMQRDNNHIIAFGPSGVGVSSAILDLQASKEDLNTPFDVISKRFYYLDTDALFAAGNPQAIVDGFQKALTTLQSQADTVLVIDDVQDFLDGMRNSGTANIVNMLMREARNNPGLKIIIEARPSTLQPLMAMHSDFSDIFTLHQIKEPAKDRLKKVLMNRAVGLTKFHEVDVTEAAVDAVVDLTTKYPGLTLNMAQPKRSVMILEGALTSLRHSAHSRPLNLQELDKSMEAIQAAIKNGGGKDDLAGKSPQELEAMKLGKQAEIDDAEKKFKAIQEKLRKAYTQQRTGEQEVESLNQRIKTLGEKEAFVARYHEAKDEEERTQIKKDYRAAYGQMLPVEKQSTVTTDFTNSLANAGMMESREMRELTSSRSEYEAEIKRNADEYKKLSSEINEGLSLETEHIFTHFSKISGLPINKLNENETDRLINLEETLKKRVFGQDEVINTISPYIRNARLGMKKPNKPIGNFFFIGPSGVGKTELATALAAALFDTDEALVTFDMTSYQEKSSVARLVGAPPGYEGYDKGGELINKARENPNAVFLYDEIEKAYTDVFDVLMRVFDKGVQADTQGKVATFGSIVNIMTSNIGAHHFANPENTYEEAMKLAEADLRNRDKSTGGSGLRPEFLNRIDAIFFFKALDDGSIKLIAQKSLKELNGQLKEKSILVDMPEEDVIAMVADNYRTPTEIAAAGRGIQSYVDKNIKSDISNIIFKRGAKPGTVRVKYNKAAKKPEVTFEEVRNDNTVKQPAVVPLTAKR